MILKEKLKKIPQNPGVYMMIDSLKNIIYVGKAKNLRNRVSQYFHDQKDRDPRVAEMIEHIHTFNYRVMDTELDALIEECRLIKKVKPRYNRQMKKEAYFYIKIPAEKYPKVTIVKEIVNDGGMYFGPFTSRHRVETAIEYLNEFYPLRKCTSPRLVKSSNGCLFKQLNTCLGVCTGRVSAEEYGIHIDKIKELFCSNHLAAIQELSNKLDTAIENLEFEKASKYREYYLSLGYIIGKLRLLRLSNKNRNILAIEFLDSALTKLFLIKGNRLIYGKVFNRKEIDSIEMRQYLNQLLRDKFLLTSKNDLHKLNARNIDEAQIIFSYLKKNRKRVLSFWIPSTRLKTEASLDATVIKIVNRITVS